MLETWRWLGMGGEREQQEQRYQVPLVPGELWETKALASARWPVPL